MSSDYLKALDIGSGLNTSHIVDAIVNAEKVPKERRINNKIEARETQISSFSEIKSNLSSLQSNLSIYDGVNGLSLNKNGTSVTASITDKSKAGQFTHEIGVSSLAKAQTLEFDGFSVLAHQLALVHLALFLERGVGVHSQRMAQPGQ